KLSDRSPLGQEILGTLLENSEIARDNKKPLCQDTGMSVVFVNMGQEVEVVGGFIGDAINQGVREGYEDGYLRKSVVNDPILRENTKDNTPAVIHYNIVPGDKFEIHISPKGFGSENKSQLKMLTPSQGEEGVKDFILQVVSEGGANACPPLIIGVGIGGTMERCAFLAKKALLRPVGENSTKPHIAAMEKELLERVNKLGIGPAGFGGDTTALDVHIEAEATHIAGLPVAVNIGCHATRHASGEL
ncbi:fumarate hydratase, partial [Porphyromonadaceae bacterium W3.11]|nr:fumarate hydratase [Porphyromonadaceae bacterium W3.11]